MRGLILSLILFQFGYLFSQTQVYEFDIKKSQLDDFTVLSADNRKVFSVSQENRFDEHEVKDSLNSYVVKNYKILLNNKGDTVVYYRKKEIVISKNKTIEEKKSGTVLEYYFNGKPAIKIENEYDKNSKTYHISIKKQQDFKGADDALKLAVLRYTKILKNRRDFVVKWIMPVAIGALVPIIFL